jgi:hypothetical protein
MIASGFLRAKAAAYLLLDDKISAQMYGWKVQRPINLGYRAPGLDFSWPWYYLICAT